MRVYGRIWDEFGNPTWQIIRTDANGYNDNVYLTALAQCLQLNTSESPFYADFGIPEQETIVSQVFPDFYAMQIQTQYAGYFSSLSIIRVPGSFPPVYNVIAVTHNGAILEMEIPT